MTTDTELTYIERTIAEHSLVAGFLDKFQDLLNSLSYEAMTDKLKTSYSDTPYVSLWTGSNEVELCVNGPDQRETMRVLRKAIGGKWDKRPRGYQFVIGREWEGAGASITIEIQGSRDEVCQKVVTGIEDVEVPEQPYRPARIEHRETVEWVCGNLLDDGEGE